MATSYYCSSLFVRGSLRMCRRDKHWVHAPEWKVPSLTNQSKAGRRGKEWRGAVTCSRLLLRPAPGAAAPSQSAANTSNRRILGFRVEELSSSPDTPPHLTSHCTVCKFTSLLSRPALSLTKAPRSARRRSCWSSVTTIHAQVVVEGSTISRLEILHLFYRAQIPAILCHLSENLSCSGQIPGPDWLPVLCSTGTSFTG